MNTEIPTNRRIANMLDHIADLLQTQDANPHRIRAYRNGARRARSTHKSLAEIVRSGDGEELENLPDIGEGLARVISTYVRTGRSNVLDRLLGETAPEQVFQQVPGIGRELAARIVSQLKVDSLEELEQAAYDGRLATVEGIGPRRIRSVRMSLAGMLSGAAQRRVQQHLDDKNAETGEQPDVRVLLKVDELYRRKADANELKKIAPKRFNPENEAWLPILHTSCNGWEFTTLYSNTARAHELGKTHDWVVLYYERDSLEGQATVVTSTHGPLQGKRIVRGREAECERLAKS